MPEFSSSPNDINLSIRDPNVENDFPVVRHNRLEQILFIWGGLTLVLISILYQVQRARHEQFQITSPKRAREANQQMELTQLQNPQEE
jgi:hypothetical protein